MDEFLRNTIKWREVYQTSNEDVISAIKTHMEKWDKPFLANTLPIGINHFLNNAFAIAYLHVTMGKCVDCDIMPLKEIEGYFLTDYSELFTRQALGWPNEIVVEK